MTSTEVIAAFSYLYASGRHGAPPPPERLRLIREHGDAWALVQVPISKLDYQTEEESSAQRIELARRYSSTGTPFPPGLATYSGRSARRRTGKGFVADGNHRVMAAKFRGDCAVTMFMPLSDYSALKADAGAGS